MSIPTARRFTLAVLVLLACAASKREKENLVLRIAHSFPDGGSYNKKWAGTGSPEEIRFIDTRILGKCENGTYCCGFTFAVVMRAGEEAKLFEGKSVEQIRQFQKQWYGAAKEADARERLCVAAMETLGVGKAVTHDQARPGDFAQFWRTSKSGHSVVFLGWMEERGKRVGIKYRSSQSSTDGIGDKVEYFSDSPADGREAKIIRERMYFCRLDFLTK